MEYERVHTNPYGSSSTSNRPAYIKWVGGAAAVVVAMLLVAALWSGGSKQQASGVYSDCSGGSCEDSVLLSDILAVGLGLTDQAAAVIKEVKRLHKENMHVKGHTAEGVIEPVTDADQRSNTIFVNGYRNHFRGITMLSEETEPAKNATIHSEVTHLSQPLVAGAERSLELRDLVITVDPLDATKEFTEDLLQYVTTMVCVVYKGRPIAGIINQVFEDSPPVVGVVGMGPGGEGNMLRGRDGRHSAEGEAAKTVTISRSHTGAGADVVTKYFPGHTSLQAGGAGYKALLVLDGTANAYVHVTKIKSWDVCAPDAVLHAVGGGFTDVEGHHLNYGIQDPVFTRGIVATQNEKSQAWYLEHLGGNLN